MDANTPDSTKPKRRASLAGTNLFVDVRTGIYVWRRMDERTGKRFKRSTATPSLQIALKKARDFEDEYQKGAAGLVVYDCWRKELRPLVDEWITAQTGDVGSRTLDTKKFRLLRALESLGLRTTADLDNVVRLQDRLLGLERAGTARVTLRRSFQDPLRQFAAWLAENNRHLDRNPLLNWKPLRLRTPKSEKQRRAFLPDEVARAFLALESLDQIHDRKHSQRPLFLLLLITAPRVGALLSRDLSNLDRERARIHFGAPVGKKRKGAGALDPRTLADLTAAIGDRETGSLLLSPDGARPAQERVLDAWREAFGLGLVDALWPKDQPRNLDVAHLTNLALLSGRIRVDKGGRPKREKILAKRSDLETRVAALVNEIGAEWRRRMEGVDVHSFRMTHRTWAEVQGVPAVLIDLQLGHEDLGAEGTIKLMSLVAGSTTGRRHYLDVNNRLFDPSRSAAAVRALLDEALPRVHEAGTCLGLSPANPPRDRTTTAPSLGMQTLP
jgi:integrase